MATIRPTSTCGCKVWTIMIVTEKILENKIQRKICGAVFDAEMGKVGENGGGRKW